MANIKSLQLLRNTSQLYETREAALTALTGSSLPNGVQDGTPVLARYRGDDGKIMTLVGFYAIGSAITGGTATGSTNMTIIDVEGSKSDVAALKAEIDAKLGTGITSATSETVTAQLTALSGNDASTSAETSVAGAKKYTDGKLDALDYTLAKDDNKVIVSLNQTDGKVSGVSENITGVKLAGLTTGSDAKIAATDTLGGALGKIQAQIDAMDKTASAVDGQVVTTVTEVDGKVTETKANVKDLQLGGYSKGSNTGDIASNDTVNVALSKLENKVAANAISNDDHSIVVTPQTGDDTDIKVNIKSGEKVILLGNDGIYTDIKVSGITPSSDNVKEEYALIASNGDQLGSSIKVYKDSSIVQIYLGTSGDTVDPSTGEITKLDGDKQYLNYVYQKADGTYEMTKINISSFLNEAEFASGVTWDATAGKVRGVVDSTSEKDESNVAFLTVGADGFKISGIKAAIDTKINKLNATINNSSNSGHVGIEIVEVDGELTTVTISENDIANKSDLDALSGKTFTVVTSSNESITTATTAASDGTVSVDLITDASKIKMSGFTAAQSGFTNITEASSITEAVKVIETVFLDNELVIANSLNDLNERIIELSGGSSADIADEIAERRRIEGQNASAYTANASSPYISAATSLNDADVKLAAALKSLSDETVNQVKVNNVALDGTNNAVNVQISGGTAAANSANAVVVDTDAAGAVTISLGTLDAGSY